jgi:hypothetical protein
MSNGCRNDCVAPLSFPREIFNRPALSHIKYRIGDYADIREALFRHLDQDENLAQWTHRGADDPGIALLEGAAILGDILTFYQELYANEAYLRTAQWRESISDLVRLLGYRLSPGLGGSATFAFEIKGDKPITVPASLPLKAEVTGLDKPADFETSEALLAYPWLSRFNLFRPLLQPDVTPSTVEFYIDSASAPVQLKPGDRMLLADLDPAPGRLNNSEIVIVDSTRVLHGTTIIKIKGGLKRTTSAPNVVAYKIGRTFRHFGHNGPIKKVLPPSSSTSTSSTTSGVTTTTTTIPAPTEITLDFFRGLKSTTSNFSNNRIVDPPVAKTDFLLDAEVQDLPVGVPLITEVLAHTQALGTGTPEWRTFVRTIAGVKTVNQTWGLLTSPTSMVTLTESLETPPASTYYFTDIRTISFHETLSGQLTLKAAMEEDLATTEGQTLLFFGTDSQVQNLQGRRIFFQMPATSSFTAAVTAVETETSPELALKPRVRLLTLDQTFTYADFPNLDPTVILFGNLVDATQGKTESQAALGNGDSRQVFQLFKLPKSPLTYLLSLGQTPPEVPELQIFVNDRLWKRVPTFFNRRYDEEIYIVREDANNESWVQFGDSVTGARLPSGIKNVEAKFRTGTGAFGALKPDTKVQPGGRVTNLDKVQMPGVAAGGSEPEDGENAREAAPGKIQSLDRLVSLKDFESEVLAISGVTVAAASWELEDNIALLFLTVLMETGREKEIDTVREVIAGYNICRGPNRFHVRVREGKLQYVALDVVYGIDPTYQETLVTPAIKNALGAVTLQSTATQTPTTTTDVVETDPTRGLFGIRNRHFGEREYATRIAGTVQNVPGVLWARVTTFMSLGEAVDSSGEPIDPATIPQPTTKSFADKVLCDGLHILALHEQHLVVSAVVEPSQGVCA